MRHIDDWDAIQEAGEYENPVPGAYIAVIRGVEDVEEKEYLSIRWDFAEGAYKGSNQETFDRAGFWPTVLMRSYKDTALRFFKSFKTSVEMSNKGYIFNDRNVQGLVGKYFGVVLGEEEYRKNNGDTGTRLYVAQVRSCKAIQDGDFKVPELKKLAGQAPRAVQPARTVPVGFSDIRDDDDGEIPF